jgi:hypothetical protein
MIEPWVIVPTLQKTCRSSVVCIQSRPVMKEECAAYTNRGSSCLGCDLVEDVEGAERSQNPSSNCSYKSRTVGNSLGLRHSLFRSLQLISFRAICMTTFSTAPLADPSVRPVPLARVAHDRQRELKFIIR